MAQTCKQAIFDVFSETPGPLTTSEVISKVNRIHPSQPWKNSTIRDHLIGLSVNHPSGKHHPGLQKHAFLFCLGNGQYKLLEAKDDTSDDELEEKVLRGEEVIPESDEDLFIPDKKVSLNERQWVTKVLELINNKLQQKGDSNLSASQGAKLPYAFEILSYNESTTTQSSMSYETDLLVYEKFGKSEWKPRVIIEGKLGRVTTHDAITYSQKALTHKNVHPYLRYGILLGDRGHYPLPGRLFRHGAYFDFMLSFKASEPSPEELEELIELIIEEVEASRNLEEILYNSRNPNRKRFTLLHKPLKLK